MCKNMLNQERERKYIASIRLNKDQIAKPRTRECHDDFFKLHYSINMFKWMSLEKCTSKHNSYSKDSTPKKNFNYKIINEVFKNNN